MSRSLQWMVLGMIAAGLPSVASAATRDVCPSGCVYSRIQDAIADSSAGDTIAVHTGTYSENVVVDKPLTIRRATHGSHPVLIPAVSNPNGPGCAGSSLCGGAASNLILVQADDVTIDGLTLDGDNPALTSGVVAGGADIDARNGIITNHAIGTFNNLTVRHVTVRNVYLRGLYASSGGTFDFEGNRVRNVQADPASIAIFNFGGAGTMADNIVSDAADAISSNWSRGVQFVRNRIVRSASGIHTDNAGGGGGSADLIRWNAVSDCTTDGYGIWVFVPYLAPTVTDNLVSGCAIGLAAFGEAAAAGAPAFSDNILDGHHASTSSGGSIGVLVTTDILGWGSTDVTASFSRLVVRRFDTGVYVEQGCELYGSYFPGDCSTPAQATATVQGSVIHDNGTGASGLGGTAVNAESNWWGCAAGPNQHGCDTAVGSVDFTPWLRHPPKPW